METHKITFKNTELDVTGTFYKGSFGAWGEAPTAHQFDIDRIDCQGLDLTELLDDNINEIENLVIDCLI
jgi:hypothetical protein